MNAIEVVVRDAVARGLAISAESDEDVSDNVANEVLDVIVPFINAPGTLVGVGNNPANEAISALNPIGVSPQSGMNVGTGDFLRHPDTGHVIGVEAAPIPANPTTEYPKWVTPHESWVQEGANGTPMAPAYVNQHIDWSDRAHPRLMVMVDSREAEDRALAQRQENETESAAENQAPNAGVGGADPSGAKTIYPAGNEDAEVADAADFAEKSADLNAETNQSKDAEAAQAEQERLKKIAKPEQRKTK